MTSGPAAAERLPALVVDLGPVGRVHHAGAHHPGRQAGARRVGRRHGLVPLAHQLAHPLGIAGLCPHAGGELLELRRCREPGDGGGQSRRLPFQAQHPGGEDI
jgi:hypothetical protein